MRSWSRPWFIYCVNLVSFIFGGIKCFFGCLWFICFVDCVNLLFFWYRRCVGFLNHIFTWFIFFVNCVNILFFGVIDPPSLSFLCFFEGTYAWSFSTSSPFGFSSTFGCSRTVAYSSSTFRTSGFSVSFSSLSNSVLIGVDGILSTLLNP